MKKVKKKRKKSKTKKIVILITIILIIILVFMLINYFYKKGINYKTSITIEIGSLVPTVYEYVDKEDIDRVGDSIEWNNLETVDNKVYKTGRYEGIITFKEENLKVILIVEDTISPVIDGSKDIEMLAFEKEPNLLEGITASDNSNENIEVSLEGEYDTEKAGEYTLSYVAEDSSGNKKVEDFKLIVKENENVKVTKTSKGYTLKNYYGITYIDNVIVVNKTYGLPSNFAPNNLSTINGYIKVVDYVKEAFNNLSSDAKSIGLNIYASSGYRSYSDQNYIYNNYVKLDGQSTADTYSARAGYSEHQTGLAIDVNTVDSSFDGTSESEWLKENCYKYGFIIRYPKGKEEITGYMYEPWHIRHVGKALAEKLYNNGNWITMEEYYGIDSKYE